MLETCKRVIDPSGEDSHIHSSSSFRQLFYNYIDMGYGDIDGYITMLDKARVLDANLKEEHKFPYWE